MQPSQARHRDYDLPALETVEEFQPRSFRLGSLVPAGLIFVLGTAVAAAAMLAVSRSERLEIVGQFQLDAEERFAAYEHEVHEVLGFLRCLGALYSASQNVVFVCFNNNISD